MNPRAWYESRLARWSDTRARDDRRATVLSRLRLVTFLAAVAMLWAGVELRSSWLLAAAAAAIPVFGFLVVRHARRLDAIARADLALAVNRRGIARLDRDWHALPAPAAPAADLAAHPYAGDLDVFGQASLLQWLGPTATVDGETRLRGWLLDPPAEGVAARQEAVAELAARAEWREALLAGNGGAPPSSAALDRLLAWAEDGRPAVPAALRVVVPLLTLLTLAPIALQQAGVVTRAWWIGPMTAGIVLSFALAGRIYRIFDAVSPGERALTQYASMFALVEREAWESDLLQRAAGELHADDGAGAVMTQLARLANWSEARRGAALLHFPLQALTLWDFHVLFAMERWRARHGRRLRAWFDALGMLDALSTLAAVRHDEPDWCMPAISGTAPAIAGAAVGHPLIAGGRRVANDVTVGPPGTLLLITGSNMSGKSTLLRAIGLNIVLARAGAPVCARSFSLPPCVLETSIRVQDSLERGLSYFMAALARLKAIVDTAERGAGPGRTVVYLLDEVLQGTNSAERAIAVRAIARHLLDAGAIGAMTTHDLGVAEEEPFAGHARMVHFSEQVHADGTMTFDYRLQPGIATSRNALRLMQLIGIEPK